MDGRPCFKAIDTGEIVIHFGREFYTMLSREPERLHCFYGPSSSLLHSLDTDMDAPVACGLDQTER